MSNKQRRKVRPPEGAEIEPLTYSRKHKAFNRRLFKISSTSEHDFVLHATKGWRRYKKRKTVDVNRAATHPAVPTSNPPKAPDTFVYSK